MDIENKPKKDQLANLGDEIRQLRKVRGITLQSMAKSIGKSVGFLSQVERNMTKPSVAALQDISEVLNIHIGWFFQADDSESEEERKYIVRQTNRRRLSYTALSNTDYLGLHDHLLSTNLNGELALGISRYEPGASTGDDSYDHTGEEAGLVLSGILELTIDHKKYLLETGDSFSFKSQLKHRYVNPSKNEDTVVVWANTPISLRR
ncbi:MAG: transcriptional regulator with XRE-family HTH domain [Gammaproteobacteria bacterium]|jgi:transcriptional regulator with XRE-family HTH domain